MSFTGSNLVERCIYFGVDWSPGIIFFVREISTPPSSKFDASGATFGVENQVAMRATVPYPMNMAHCASSWRLAMAVMVMVMVMESENGESDSLLEGDGKSDCKLIS